MKLYAEISKVEPQDDGTLKVWGYASSEAVDSEGETITSDAMKAALPDYMKFGAVREMHQPSAAGTAIEASVGDDGKTFFGAHVVDPVAVKKVTTGTYKGFSIGGKVTERDADDKKIIKGLKLVEVSLVDRPANPEAVFTMYKAERAPEEDVNELADMLDKGVVTPAKVLELIKGAQAAPVVEEKVEKGMYSLSDFASVLSSIGYLAAGSEWEAQSEGDNSPVPASLRTWLADGLTIFQDMAAEECAEMIADLNEMAGEQDVISMADGKLTLTKAGAKFSGKTKEALGDIHKAMLGVCDKMAGLGYDKDEDDKKDDDVESAAQVEGLKKAASIAEESLSKVTGERDELQKAADILKARVAELEAMPQPGKALLKAMDKGQDVQSDDAQKAVESFQPVRTAAGDVDEPSTLIKAIHTAGARRLIG